MKIEEAKKYIDKIIYFISDEGIEKLYIGGLELFFNKVDFDVQEFVVYEDKKCTKCWGSVKISDVTNSFDYKKDHYAYTFSKKVADQYKSHLAKTERQRKIDYALERASEILKEAKLDFEIIINHS